MMRSVVLVLVLGSVAQAAPLKLQWVSGENIHIANQGGAINRHRDVTITLDLGTHGKAKVVDTGTWRDHNLYPNNSTTEDKVVWTNTWSGTWKQTGDKLALTLTLADRKCTATKTYDRGKPELQTCRTVTKQIKFACTTTFVTVESWTGTTLNKPTLAAWQCLPEGTAELADTPTGWTFGKTTCIRTLEGLRRTRYEPCATSP